MWHAHLHRFEQLPSVAIGFAEKTGDEEGIQSYMCALFMCVCTYSTMSKYTSSNCVKKKLPEIVEN